MVNYNHGKIYKIFNSFNKEVYIGSTCMQLLPRINYHRSVAIRCPVNCHRLHADMNKYGIDAYHIVLIERFPCKKRQELKERENYWIKILKPSYNIKNPYPRNKDKKPAVKPVCDACHFTGASSSHYLKHCHTRKHKRNMLRLDSKKDSDNEESD